MRDTSPDAALFAALVEARRRPQRARPEQAAADIAELILRLADTIRHGSALLREAAGELAAARESRRLPGLLAEAEAVAAEQAACARALLAALVPVGEPRAA